MVNGYKRALNIIGITMRNNLSPKPVSRLFDHLNLKNLQATSCALSSINNAFIQLLPKTLSEQCRVANYRQGILIVEVASASWLTRLRYEQERLISSLRKTKLSGLASIQYKINPDLNKSRCILQNQTTTYATRTISKQTADILLTLAEEMPPKLKSSLIKLAKHATKMDNNEQEQHL